MSIVDNITLINILSIFISIYIIIIIREILLFNFLYKFKMDKAYKKLKKMGFKETSFGNWESTRSENKILINEIELINYNYNIKKVLRKINKKEK